MSFYVVPGDESFATQIIVIKIHTSENLHVSLSVISKEHKDIDFSQHDISYVSLYGSRRCILSTKNILIWMVPSVTIHVSH